MQSTPKSDNAAPKKPTLFIPAGDPRLKTPLALANAFSKSNAEIQTLNNFNLQSISLSALSSSASASINLPSSPGSGNSGGGGNVTQANAPLQVTNLTANYSGDNIVTTFTFDTTDLANYYFSSFIIQVYNPNTSSWIPLQTFSPESLNKSSSSQSLTINPSQLSYTGLSNLTIFTQIEIATFAAQFTNGYVQSNTFSYVCDLPAPVITVSHSVASYTVTITNFATLQTYSDFYDVIIQEFISNDTLSQVQAEDTAKTSIWNQAGPYTITNTETILAADGNHRWVRAYAQSKSGGQSPASNYVDVTPDALNPSNLTAPNNVTSATAAWSGNNVVITFAQASSNPGSNVNVSLVPVINGNASTTIFGVFTKPLVSGATTFTINQQQLLGYFGQYYISFQAHVYTTSQQNVPSTTTIDIATFSQTNTLAGVTPTASIVNTVDGYGVNFSLGTTGADYGEVYQFYQNPTFLISVLDPPDYIDATYVSGSGTSTLVVNNLTYEGGGMSIPSATDPTQYFGYQITGSNLPSSANVFVSAITYNSGTQQYSLSLSYYNSSGTLTPYFLSSATGNYHMQSLVYSGVGPASVYNTLYTNSLYIVVAYYTYGGFRTNNSYPTYSYIANPINPAQSVISNSVQIGSGGAIYVGASATTGSRIVLGPSGNKGPDGSSAYSGIFAFDYGSASSTAASTAIITNPGASGYTFETTNAKIADWVIGSSSIQNTLNSASNYVGMSATGTYSFWAGSSTSGGDALANFSVTPQGAVVARKISIYGTGISTDTLISAGSGTFTVKGDGSVTASNATITGTLNVSLPSTFDSNINMTSNGIFSAFGTLADGTTAATQTTGSSVQIRGGGFTDQLSRSIYGGLFAYDTSHNITTWIVSKPIPFTLNGRTTGFTFQTNAALLGTSEGTGWIVQDSTIQSGNGKITLDASAKTINVLAGDNNGYGVTLSAAATAAGGTGGIPTGYAIQAGLTGNPNFTVDHKGTLTATGAIINGVLKSSASATGSTTSSLPGYYFNNADGSFILGEANTYIQYAGSGNPIYMTTTIPSGYYVGSDGNYHSQPQTQTLSLSQSGLHINGLSVYGDDTRLSSISSSYSPFTRVIQYAPQNQTYGNTQMIGGDAVTGFAVYYGNHSPVGSTGTGFSGDFWVQI